MHTSYTEKTYNFGIPSALPVWISNLVTILEHSISYFLQFRLGSQSARLLPHATDLTIHLLNSRR